MKQNMEAASATFINVFMNIILPILGLLLVTTYLNIYMFVTPYWETCALHSFNHLIGFFWETKIEFFRKAASKETCFSFYLEKENFYAIILAIKFYYGGKKSNFSVEFLLSWKKKREKTLIKCAILLTFLAKKVTCNILEN